MVVVVGFLLCSAFGNAMVLGHNPFIVLIVPLAPGPLPPPFPPGTFPVQMVSYQLIPCLQPNGLIFLEKTHSCHKSSHLYVIQNLHQSLKTAQQCHSFLDICFALL